MDFIQLDDQQYNTYGDPQPLFQDWGNAHLATINYNPNFPLYPPILYMPIKDYIGVPEFSQYSQFRIQLYQYSPYVQHLLPSGMTSNPFVLTNNGLVLETMPIFQNLDLLTDDYYEHGYAFVVSGLLGSSWQYITSFTYYILLNKTTAAVSWSPSNFDILHQQGNAFNIYDISMQGSNWSLSAHSDKIVFIPSPDITITTIPGGTTVVSGTSNQVVQFRLANVYDTASIPELQSPSFQSVFITVLFSALQPIDVISLNVNTIANGFIYTNIGEMHFEATKGIAEPIKQFAGVSAAIAPILIDKSPWLTVVSATSENGVFPFQNGYDIKPIATSNMVPGFYTGFVRFYVYNNDATYFPVGEYSRTITVTYQLFGDIVAPYNNEKIALTLTPVYYQFFAQNPNTYFDVRLELKTYIFNTFEPKTKIINIKIALFEQKAKEFLGKIIHRLMPLPPFTNRNRAMPAELIIIINEKNIITHQVVRTLSSTIQKFIAGYNKPNFGNIIYLNTQFLNINRNPKRVFKNQYYFFSWYQDGDYTPTIDYLINNEIVPTPSPLAIITNAQQVFCRSVLLNNINQGDVITINIYQNPNNQPPENLINYNEQTETLICFPAPKHWHDILWVDEFKLLKNFIFGGDFSIESDKEYISNRKYNGIFEILENIEISSIKKLIINTGWMLKTDTETIESLMNSHKVILVLRYLNNGRIDESLELTPISKKIIHENSTDMTIEMSVEFEIAPSR
jgi:hypothetical protein